MSSIAIRFIGLCDHGCFQDIRILFQYTTCGRFGSVRIARSHGPAATLVSSNKCVNFLFELQNFSFNSFFDLFSSAIWMRAARRVLCLALTHTID